MKTKINQKGKLKGLWYLKKFASQKDFENNNPYFNEFIGQNLLLNEGINEMWTLICSSSGTKFDNSNAYLGVGTDNTVADATQTGLLGSPVYQEMDTGFPTYGTDQKATFQATFNGATANQDWKEFTVANGSDNTAKNMNRLVSDQGTKISGQVWQLQLIITLS